MRRETSKVGTFHSMKNGKFPGEVQAEKRLKAENRIFKRGERVGLLLSSVMLCYAIINWDIPLACFLLAFIALNVHLWIDRTGSQKLRPLSNALKGWGITMMIGSIIMIFV